MHRILIFDDDRDILDLCSIVLKKQGYEVILKESCENVLNVVRHEHPAVILMDNWMPGLTGAEAIVLLKEHEPLRSIPVIFFSANSQGEQISIRSGADFFLQKPFDIRTLVDMVRKAISHARVAVNS